MVITARVGVAGAELGIAERTRQGNECTKDPDSHQPAGILGNASHHAGGLEDSGPHDNADDNGNGAQRSQDLLRLRGDSC